MSNIIKIVMSDFRRLSTNVVAIVIIMGLSVIPCLYAWFNIFSNWAPYDEEATSNVSIAIVSNDKGVKLEDIEVNIGGIVLDNLKSNHSINWIFTDTDHEAIEGVKSGKYYAAFVIDEEFTPDMISFIGGDVKHPRITYYENDKKNAIAPKITGKVKTTIQQEVNQSFLSAIVEGGLEAATGINGETAGSGGNAMSRLELLDDDLTSCVNLIDTYITLVDSTESVVKAANEISEEADMLKDSFAALSEGASSTIAAADATVDSAAGMISVNLDDIEDDLREVDSKIEKVFNVADKVVAISNADVEALRVIFENLEDRYTAMRKQITDVGIDPGEEVIEKADKVDEDFENINKDLKKLKKYNSKTEKDAEAIYNDLKDHTRVCIRDVRKLSSEYKNTVAPQLGDSLDSVKRSVEDVKDMLNYSDSSIESTMGILSSYPDMMSLGKEKLVDCRDEVRAMQKDLRKMMRKLESAKNNEQYTALMELLKDDPTELAEFITSPVDVQTKGFFPIENNGSAMAPFYIVLSQWFGALILVALIHTEVHPIPGVERMRNYEMYFGRYLIFFLIGQFQTLITYLGVILFVEIQCKHPFLLWVDMAVTSFAYTMLIYSLAYALGAIGEATAVVVMVIQVAGSGGTFPVEVLPEIYQKLYRFMPFGYSISAAREAVAGLYENDFAIYISRLFCVVGVALVIGLVLAIPGRKLTAIIEESAEKTGLM